MKKLINTLLYWMIFPISCFALEVKVSDQYPTLLELDGTIEKVSFGNGHKEYVASIEGRFLEIKAKKAQTSITTLTIHYIGNEGKKNQRLEVFRCTLRYDPSIHPIYRLNQNRQDDQTSDASLSPTLSSIIQYMESHPGTIRRLATRKQKIRCMIKSMISTGTDLVVQFVLLNRSPYRYRVGENYFVINNKEKKRITPKIQPRDICLEPGESRSIMVIINHQVHKQGLTAHFEEEKGTRHIQIKIPNSMLLRVPCWKSNANHDR